MNYKKTMLIASTVVYIPAGTLLWLVGGWKLLLGVVLFGWAMKLYDAAEEKP
jgi:hypothetical protein